MTLYVVIFLSLFVLPFCPFLRFVFRAAPFHTVISFREKLAERNVRHAIAPSLSSKDYGVCDKRAFSIHCAFLSMDLLSRDASERNSFILSGLKSLFTSIAL